MTVPLRIIIALLIGLLSGWLCTLTLISIRFAAGDFSQALRSAGDLLSGVDPYRLAPGPYNIPYPIPAALLAIPFTRLNEYVAAGLFLGSSSAMLAWLILSKGKAWQLCIFLTAPFYYAMSFAQWAPLVLCLYFCPYFLPVILMKPNIALPLAMLRYPGRVELVLTAAVCLISLLIYPGWPMVWIQQLSAYQGLIPPLLNLPFGPLLLLALLKYRDQRCWLLILMSLMPQRMLYDQLALLLIARNCREIFILGICSWVSFFAVLFYGNWGYLPGGWQLWILLTLYYPALLVLLVPCTAKSEVSVVTETQPDKG